MNDTIFAAATAPGRAAIAVVRLSGPRAGEALAAMAGGLPEPRRATVRMLRDPRTGEALDRALALWLPAPASYTGEDQAELHLHGGRAVVEGVLASLSRLGLRLAEPGAFTRRAFEHGKLDLTEAEGVADLIDAETEQQRRQALAELGGALTARHAAWRETLTDALALLEAEIDFPDEGVPGGLVEQARAVLRPLRSEIAAAAADLRGERVREGYRVALVGAPNAGKSSLLNSLVERDAAIVTATPGTTRDVIEQPLTLAGYRVLLADMAGLREASDEIEAEGVRRARAWAEGADLRLLVVDRSGTDGVWRRPAELVRPNDLLLLNKSDLAEGADGFAARAWASAKGVAVLEICAFAGYDLRAVLAQRVLRDLGGGEFPAATRLRHRELLGEAEAHLGRALDSLSAEAELVAESVRLAARALEKLAGRIDSEAILDRVFGSFCIGK